MSKLARVGFGLVVIGLTIQLVGVIILVAGD